MSRPAGPFEALGDPTRRHLLGLLAGGEHSVGGLVDALGTVSPMSQPAVSQHLAVLRAAGLVTVRADGNRRCYSLDPVGIDGARRWLTELVDPLAGAEGPLKALGTELARGERARRTAERAPRPGHEPGTSRSA